MQARDRETHADTEWFLAKVGTARRLAATIECLAKLCFLTFAFDN